MEGALVDDQNYFTLAFNGSKNNRALTIVCYDKTNTKRWEQTINADELK